MAFNNYPGLIAAVQEFTGRSDLTTSKVDHFIDLAEAFFDQNLRTHHQETTNGSFTVSSGAITNPSDLLQWKRLSVSVSGATRLLQPLTQEQVGMLTDGTPDVPTGYYVRGGQTLLSPPPDGSYTISGTYYQRVPALSDSSSTNWITTNYADAYLYGTLAMSHAYIADDPRLPLWKSLFDQSIAGIISTDQKKGFGQVPVMTTEYPVY